MKSKVAWHRVPIYGCWFIVILADNLEAERAKTKWSKIFGPYHPDGDTSGMTCYSGPCFAVFFQKGKWLTHGTLSHEIFHATHRIHERAENPCHPNHHEPFCYLCAYLTQLVYEDLKKWKAKVR